MKSIIMKNPSRTLALNQPEYERLDIVDLPLDEENTNQNMMLSLWQPDEEERKLLAKGGVVQLYILGRKHPPVKMMVQAKEDTWRLQ